MTNGHVDRLVTDSRVSFKRDSNKSGIRLALTDGHKLPGEYIGTCSSKAICVKSQRQIGSRHEGIFFYLKPGTSDLSIIGRFWEVKENRSAFWKASRGSVILRSVLRYSARF